MKSLARVAALIAGVLACVATSAPQYRWDRSYPKWQVPPMSVQTIDCASLQTWISKTGKTGVGISVLATTTQPQCQVRIESMAFVVGDAQRVARALPPVAMVRSDSPVHFYFPVEFENEAFWNRGSNSGELTIAVRAGQAGGNIVLAAQQTGFKAHVRVPIYDAHRRYNQGDSGQGDDAKPPIRTVSTIADAPLELVPVSQ